MMYDKRGSKNPFFGKKHSVESKKKQSSNIKKWYKEHEGFRNSGMFKKGNIPWAKGKKTPEKTKEKVRETIKAKGLDKIYSLRMKSVNPMKSDEQRERMRNHNPMKNLETAKKMGKTAKKRHKENPDYFDKVYKNTATKAWEKSRGNNGVVWEGVPFANVSEMECAVCLLNKPIHRVNCNIRLNGKEIDFYPKSYDRHLKGIYVEYHPWDLRGLTYIQYYKERKKIVGNNRLVIIKNLDLFRR